MSTAKSRTGQRQSAAATRKFATTDTRKKEKEKEKERNKRDKEDVIPEAPARVPSRPVTPKPMYDTREGR
jgi:hypothetical protein